MDRFSNYLSLLKKKWFLNWNGLKTNVVYENTLYTKLTSWFRSNFDFPVFFKLDNLIGWHCSFGFNEYEPQL